MGPLIADITRAIIALGLAGACIWLFIHDRPLPAELSAFLGGAVVDGLYRGRKAVVERKEK